MKPRVKNILVVAAIFVAGVVTGSVNSIGVGQRLVEHRLGIEHLHSTLMEILDSELKLTPEQAARLDPVVRQSCEEYRGLVLETVQRVSGLVQKTNGRLMRELTPEQAERLKQLETQRQENVRRRLDQEFLKKDFLGE
jgi:hypothetical protein